jgi:hypothetical protein
MVNICLIQLWWYIVIRAVLVYPILLLYAPKNPAFLTKSALYFRKIMGTQNGNAHNFIWFSDDKKPIKDIADLAARAAFVSGFS